MLGEPDDTKQLTILDEQLIWYGDCFIYFTANIYRNNKTYLPGRTIIRSPNFRDKTNTPQNFEQYVMEEQLNLEYEKLRVMSQNYNFEPDTTRIIRGQLKLDFDSSGVLKIDRYKHIAPPEVSEALP
jgi:hypothetical protein